MSALPTSSSGYIGSHMDLELLDQSEEVVALNRLSAGFDWAVPDMTTLAMGDIAALTPVEEVIRKHDVDAIIYFAGPIIVPASVSDSLGDKLNNTVKSRSLIERAAHCEVRHFIFSSMTAVCSSPERFPVDEEAEVRPGFPYGTSKMMTELMLRDSAAVHDFDYTALRYFNISGTDPQLRTGQLTKGATHLIKVAYEFAIGKRSHMEVFSPDYDTPDATCTRDYPRIRSGERTLSNAAPHVSGRGSLVARHGYGNGYTVHEVIEAMKEVTQTDFDVRIGDRKLGDAVAIASETEWCRRGLLWEPRYDDLHQIVTHALN